MTPEQCKMARAGLGLSVRDIAERARVSTNTVTRFENGEALKERTVDAIRDVLTAAGVVLIPENGGGVGVRLKKSGDPAADATVTVESTPPKSASARKKFAPKKYPAEFYNKLFGPSEKEK